MYNVGGRVRKGKPFQLGTNFGHGFRDAGHRGGGFNRYAHSAVPSLVDWSFQDSRTGSD